MHRRACRTAASLGGASTLAELSATLPQPGGVYVVLREAYGPLPAFLFGWTKLLLTGSASVAAGSLTVAAYAGVFVPLDDGRQRLVAAGRVFGAAGSALVAGWAMVSTFSSLNGTLLATPRVLYSMAVDGLFFRSVAAVHPRYRAPHVAALLYVVLAVVGVTTRTFEQLALAFVVGNRPLHALAVAALFVSRRARFSRYVPSSCCGKFT